ncbi:hypothetical protein DR64_819 [Paraburkholderia xenovorans LB400]|jgi:hypothetical protein|uniref:Uncharacterized protein n=1 Tax=Paraburkholderia xenovorans (strain LB400) TaxID=266265 RepID=Q141Y9_PARXL|nr:hypothetical protein [Paraburkholderia xenovorans]ABE29850.1 Hypothetical protein Bxe_A3129 [Paraburkholderia xenovorans LB400]AIP33418.1 hypothetical protein DR64_819 [Paraburkholderia xenovorans LB400]NPT39517.1 hypothetical protein [Paraburkholderia xenovorans]
MNGVNPLVSPNPVGNNYGGGGGGGGSMLSPNGGVSINSVAELCEKLLKKANANLADAMNEAQNQADGQQANGQAAGGGQGGAGDNLSLMKVQQAQGNVTAINQEGVSLIQAATDSLKTTAQAIK